MQNSYAGNAAGFKLSALQQLTDLRSNKPRMTLLHYIVDVAMADNPSLLDFTLQLATVKEARRLSLETLAAELRGWKGQVDQLQTQMASADADLTELMNGNSVFIEIFILLWFLNPYLDPDFLTEAEGKVTNLEVVLNDIESASKQLAIHFSEDPAKIKLADCFSVFSDLLDKIDNARKENEMRRKQEERTARLAEEKAKQALLAASTPGSAKKTTSGRKIPGPEEEEVCIVDRLLSDIRRGEFKLRKAG